MNLSGTLNVFKLLRDPALCLPHYTVSTFNQLPVPLSRALTRPDGKPVDIRAVVLDKDNCFAVPHTDEVHPEYKAKFQELREAYPGSKLLIVSNTAGTASDPAHAQAELLQRNTGIRVLHHNTKKPGCRSEVFEYFRNAPDAGVTSPSQIAVVGDRLFTDVMMANLMGAHGFWVKDGTIGPHSFFAKAEHKLAAFLLWRKYSAPAPRSTVE
ncbi:had superfamily phosphatase [Diplodia corticola]|uniref:Had superfamily phosphatase n=1 Tax=Diplodia corticola TaxID=236234 RepID=A0A1J9QRX2_9PEZI|nr:had superfamily phosphatase [Diplodia corticola]OJD31169.1 had superfamily phosphatase [Diplodia corticola]